MIDLCFVDAGDCHLVLGKLTSCLHEVSDSCGCVLFPAAQGSQALLPVTDLCQAPGCQIPESQVHLDHVCVAEQPERSAVLLAEIESLHMQDELLEILAWY